MWLVGGSMLNIKNTGKTESQQPPRVTVTSYTGHAAYMTRNIIIWIIAVFIQNTPLHVCIFNSLAIICPEQGFVLKGSRKGGFQSYLTLPAATHSPLSPPVTQLWPCAAH